MTGPAEVRRARPLLGTLVEIRASGACDETMLHAAVEQAFAAVARIHAQFSVHEADSAASRLNRTAHREPVRLDPAMQAVLAAAWRFSEASDGAFDLAVGARLQALGLLPEAGTTGDARANWRDLEWLDAATVRFRRPMRLDFGGIAKGYAVDQAIDVLRAAGLASALVNAGGDLRVAGSHPQAIAIRDARDPARCARRIELRNEALATSAAYFSRTDDGQRSALIDPRSGAPYLGCDSVSVIAADAMSADALTKIVLFAPAARSAAILAQCNARAIVQRADDACEAPTAPARPQASGHGGSLE